MQGKELNSSFNQSLERKREDFGMTENLEPLRERLLRYHPPEVFAWHISRARSLTSGGKGQDLRIWASRYTPVMVVSAATSPVSSLRIS
jgi:hypothetical protein